MAIVQCPHCRGDVLNDGSIVGQVVCPHCAGEFTIARQRRVNRASPNPTTPKTGCLRLASGTEYRFSAVLLFDVAAIKTADTLKAKMQTNQSGFSSGLGFMGSFTWVVTHAIVRDVVEGLISSGMAKTAKGQAEQLYQACIAVRNSGKWIELDKIENIKVPVPSLWRHLVTDQNGAVTAGYILNDDPCVALRTNDGLISIIWDKVESYIVT